MNDRTRLDDAIDRAVREIMRRDPPAGLRGRVLSRLDSPVRRLRLWPVAIAATAAGALIAAFLLRPAPAALPETPLARTDAPAPPSAASPVSPAAAAPVALEPPRARRASAPVRMATFGPRDGRISAATVSTGLRDADAAPTIPAEEPPVSALPPIVVTPLMPPPPLIVPPIVVPPLLVVRPPPPEESPR